MIAGTENILSAVSISTPQILFPTGIGVRDKLEALGVPAVVEKPSIGQNLSNDILVLNVYVKDDGSLHVLFQDAASFKVALDEYIESKQGIIAHSISNHMRLSLMSRIFSTTSDPTSGPKASDWELVVAVGLFLFILVLR